MNIRNYLDSMWVLFPMGTGALIGLMAHDSIDPILRHMGFDDFAQKIGGLLTGVLGIYLFTNMDDFIEDLGIGIATMGSALFLVGLFDLDELYEL